MTTYTCLKYHIVFGTRYRRSLIMPELRSDLFACIGGIIRDEGGILDAAGGVDDHIHLLAGIPSKIAVSDMLRIIKAGSSKWINDNRRSQLHFEWQRCFGAFTVSKSGMPDVIQYIRNQAAHHSRMSFADEFRALLIRHGVSFDDKYLFELELSG